MKNYGIHDDEVRKKFPATIKKRQTAWAIHNIYCIFAESLRRWALTSYGRNGKSDKKKRII